MQLTTFKDRSSRGFSLVELMIAMALGLFLISSMIAVFAGNTRSNQLNSATADLQESARYALEQISRDIRISGYAGCLRIDSPSSINVLAANSPTNNLFNSSVTGAVVSATSSWVPPLPGLDAPTVDKPKPGTHVLMLQYGGPDSSGLAEEIADDTIPDPTQNAITFNNPQLANGDLAIISNCDFGDLFEVTSLGTLGTDTVIGHIAPQNSSGAFSRAYGSKTTLNETKVMRFHSNVYYIGDSGQRNDDDQPVYSLFQQSLPYNEPTNPAVELITGVENFRVQFGIRNPSTGNFRYVTADDPSFNPNFIESVRLGLLMVSFDEVADVDDTSTYVIAGDAIEPEGLGVALSESHPTDRRFRLAFTTTVSVRNRGNPL